MTEQDETTQPAQQDRGLGWSQTTLLKGGYRGEPCVASSQAQAPFQLIMVNEHNLHHGGSAAFKHLTKGTEFTLSRHALTHAQAA